MSVPDANNSDAATIKRMVNALYLELPKAVADDVRTKVLALLARAETAEAERDALRVELAALDDPRHIVEFGDDNWSMQHPIKCRPDLIGCIVNQAVTDDAFDGPPEPEGRYVVTLNRYRKPKYTYLAAVERPR